MKSEQGVVMSSLTRNFATSAAKENEGIKLRFGPVTFHAKRMGGSNKAYAKYMEEALKPYRAAMIRNQMDPDLLFELQVAGFCRFCLISVEGLTEDDEANTPITAKEAVFAELMKPELEDTTSLILQEFSKPGNFTLYDLEDDAKNLPKP